MRTVKSPEERRTEILDVSEKLFTTVGYSQTTILDILNEIGIAKGTFYYYFKSKEEVLDSIIKRIINTIVAESKKIADNPNLTAIQKFYKILLSQKPQYGDSKVKMIEEFQKPNNAEMYQKSLVLTIQEITPLLTTVVEQGISENSMTTDYPKETVEILLAGAQVIFDDVLFHWSQEDIQKKALSFIHIIEAALGTQKGALQDMINILY